MSQSMAKSTFRSNRSLVRMSRSCLWQWTPPSCQARLIEIRLVAVLGSVEYYGTPTVKKTVSGLGSVTSLGNP